MPISQGGATLSASPLWKQAVDGCTQAFQRVGVESRMGMKLCGTFLEASLPAPELRSEVVAGVVRDLLSLLEKFGIATRDDTHCVMGNLTRG